MRPIQLYLAAGLSLALAFSGVLYLSSTALRQDQARQEARQQANLEENVRLALWRMDSEMAAVIAAENARPYFDYGAFYALDRAYARMVAEVGASEQIVPSPLLLSTPAGILLHFQFDADARLSSPQAPSGPLRTRALRLVGESQLEGATGRLDTLAARLQPAVVEDLRASWEGRQGPEEQAALPVAPTDNSSAFSQSLKNTVEFNQRSKSVRKASSYNPSYAQADQKVQAAVVTKQLAVPEGAMVPIWSEGQLFLVRSVRVGEQRILQGCWMDWPALEARLKGEVADILPGVRLSPATLQDRSSGRRLASIPVHLEPGPTVPLAWDEAGFEVWTSLVVAWAGVLVATFAVLLLLLGAVSLGERRAVFVSAVTHELRTPLTTFRMYADMLADGMVTDPQKAQRYLETLRREAVRLGHLVENVLAYSKIERGRASAPPETVDTEALWARFQARLADRATEARMELVPEIGPGRLHVDVSAVEQILFNLVDNACKYAGGATDRRIHLVARQERGRVVVTVSDHGPGISKEDRRGLFSPFSKSAQRAALSAPGVGLGLALSRRLAKAMGGRLEYAGSEAGARFVLTLPAA